MDSQASDPGPSPVAAFSPVQRELRLSDKVAQAIYEKILANDLSPGTVLPAERELAEQLDVSRTVIREAVRLLVARGVIESRPGERLRVAQLDDSHVSDSLDRFIRRSQLDYTKVHEIRAAIEPEMAAISAARRTAEQLGRLRTAEERFERLVRDGDLQQAALVDVEFHDLIADATGNELFRVLLSALGEALIDVRRKNLGAGAGQEAVLEHATILECIAAQDPEGARETMRAHLERMRRVRASMAEPGPVRKSDENPPGDLVPD